MNNAIHINFRESEDINEVRLKHMDQWAEKICERTFMKETTDCGVPDGVAVMAAIKFITRVAKRRPDLLDKDKLIRLVEVSIDNLPNTQAKA